jgi:iron complex transport system substrate-binding protein
MFAAAGLKPYASVVRGWGPLPLEELVLRKPALVAAAFFDRKTNHVDNWSGTRHPVTRRQIGGVPLAAIPGATTTCQGWFVADAIEALAKAGDAVRAGQEPDVTAP